MFSKARSEASLIKIGLAFTLLLLVSVAGISRAQESTDDGLERTAGSHNGGESLTGGEQSRAAEDSGKTVEHTQEAAATDGEAEGGHAGETHDAGHGGSHLGAKLPIWSATPFIGILLSIALFPLFAPHWWHKNFPKVSGFWALVFAIPFLIAYRGDALYEILHIYLVDYIPFIILLWGLFTVSGGILLSGTLVGTPAVNLLMLLVGTILASWMGTTGASMVLIRPVLRANRKRKNKMHVIIFFIFLVSNIGGSLTPLGDPPLFLGFLHGVPFFWTMGLLPHMSFIAGILLALFFALDTVLYRREKQQLVSASPAENIPLKLQGLHNLVFLGGVMGAVLFSGTVRVGDVNLLGVHMTWEAIIRDLTIVLMIWLSMKTTRAQIRRDNGFTWFPIQEVAYLFAGIFMTIIPALVMLRAGSEGALDFIIDFVKEPAHYFWITGSLSSFLDNAPTYLTFYNLAQGRFGLDDILVNQILTGQATHPAAKYFIMDLTAISVGAVFFGAMTYIGNAPNFMVRSIAEANRVKMPSFFGYMVWSVGILVPLFVLVSLIFFR